LPIFFIMGSVIIGRVCNASSAWLAEGAWGKKRLASASMALK
jgi:hypothetical protein